MSFDKTKTMKSAERFLSLGKLRAAINEYKKVVEDNPKDFSTLNIMGDLYVKNSEEREAVECYTQVAEHYYGQGFAQKAIAIYNKIARIKPDSMEVSERLAQLYQMRGSRAEARAQYSRIAEFLEGKGQKIEALEIWKKIAELDPKDTEVYLTIGETYLRENQKAEAVEAFAEAGLRFNTREKYEAAISAFSKGMVVQSNHLKTLRGFVTAKIGLGCADEAAETLEKVLEENPYSRDVLNLLIDCYLDMKAPAKAEETVIKLVQQEPTHFPKFLEVVREYMEVDDFESSVRALSISFEHLMGAGLSEEFGKWVNEILARNPEFIDGLRLLVKFHSWHRDPAEIRKALERLAETARLTESVDDERFALGQLASISPLQPEYTKRLNELKLKYGFKDAEIPVMEFDAAPEFEDFIALNSDEIPVNLHQGSDQQSSAAEVGYDFDSGVGSAKEFAGSATVRDFEFFSDEQRQAEDQYPEIAKDVSFEDSEDPNVSRNKTYSVPMITADVVRLESEIESVGFYIHQGYTDLALKCLDALREEFGDDPRILDLRRTIAGDIEPSVEILQEVKENNLIELEPISIVADTPLELIDEVMSPAVNVFEQFRSDLGLEEFEDNGEGDYSTIYHTAIAYKEMGLMEEAIKEFQDAINMVEINDGTRRYFQCANLLGHCFMMKGMPNLAQTWFKRALEPKGLIDEEIQALNYELANAYEASGEKEKAFEYFEQVYALDVDYRDIGQRIQNLKENYSSSMIN